MASIDARKVSIDAFGSKFHVTVDDGGSQSEHDVIVGASDRLRLCPDGTAELLVTKTFEFLLAREPKEAILKEFALMEVAKFFPDYEAEIARACAEVSSEGS